MHFTVYFVQIYLAVLASLELMFLSLHSFDRLFHVRAQITTDFLVHICGLGLLAELHAFATGWELFTVNSISEVNTRH